jgi:anti-sigma factor RsiW
MICCEELLREISSYIDEEITSELRVQIESHLCACRHCKVVVDTTKKTLTLVADNSFLELPQGVSERLLERLARHRSSSR